MKKSEIARPISEYHEDFGYVLWWRFPINEPPMVGSPTDSDWPGHHTHWTPLPDEVIEFVEATKSEE